MFVFVYTCSFIVWMCVSVTILKILTIKVKYMQEKVWEKQMFITLQMFSELCVYCLHSFSSSLRMSRGVEMSRAPHFVTHESKIGEPCLISVSFRSSSTGRLDVSVTAMSLSDQSLQFFPVSARVSAVRARGLRIKGKDGTNDAYAALQAGRETFRTPVSEKRAEPVWGGDDAAFIFTMPPEAADLQVRVLHRVPLGADKLLGLAVVDVHELRRDSERENPQWFKLLNKAGKADKERGEVLLDVQFLKSSMSVSMIDLSDKSHSRLGKFKDKLRGKKKDGLSDSASAILPSVTQVLTDSEEEMDEDKDTKKKKKNKLKSLFVPKSNMKRNSLSQSMSALGTLPDKNSSISSSTSSGLNVESSEGKKKKKFTFLTHKRTGSTDSKASNQSDFTNGSTNQNPASQIDICINGSHIYKEETQSEEVQEMDEEEEEEENEEEGEKWRREGEEQERLEEMRRREAIEERKRKEKEEQRRKEKEEKERMRVEQEKEERRRMEEEERNRIRMEREMEERERIRMEREKEERKRMEEKERERIQIEKEKEEIEKIRIEREKEERERIKMEREKEEERRRMEEEERQRIRIEREKEEMRRMEEEERERISREREKEERRRMEEEERDRIRIEREKEEQKKRMDEEEKERIRMEREREKQMKSVEEERERQRIEKEEQRAKMEEERKRMREKETEAEELRRKEESDRKKAEEEEMMRIAEEEKKQAERTQMMEEEEKEKVKRAKMERKLAEEKEAREEEKRRIEEENEKRRKEEERVREEKERKRAEMELKRKEEEKERRNMEMEEKKKKETQMRDDQERLRKEDVLFEERVTTQSTDFTRSARISNVKPRQHAVKPLSAAEPEMYESRVSDKTQPNTKVAEAVKGPYSQLTQAELISLVLRQQEQLSQRDARIQELEQYIDNLLVHVMEEKPSILMSMNAMKKSV